MIIGMGVAVVADGHKPHRFCLCNECFTILACVCMHSHHEHGGRNLLPVHYLEDVRCSIQWTVVECQVYGFFSGGRRQCREQEWDDEQFPDD